MITAIYTISGIKDQFELMHLGGTIGGWMIGHPETILKDYKEYEEDDHGN